MAVAFIKLLDPARREHPTHRPYAGPAFLRSPPPSALPWPKFFKSSTLKSKSQITGSPHTIPRSPPEIGKQSDAISPQSAHELTTTGVQTTKRYLSPAQTEDRGAARDTRQINPTNNFRGPTPKVDKYGRVQSSGKPLEIWERRAAQKDTTGRCSHYLTDKPSQKHTARRMDQNWRTSVVEDKTAKHAKSNSDDDYRTLVDGDNKSLVDEDEEWPDVDSRALAKQDKLYVFVTNPLKWQDINDLRSSLPATARISVNIEVHVEVCREKSRSTGYDFEERGEGMTGFISTFLL